MTMSWNEDSYLSSTFGWTVDLPGLGRGVAERLALEVDRRFPEVTDGWMPDVSGPHFSCHTYLRRDAVARVAEGLRCAGDRHSENLVADIELWIDRVAASAKNLDRSEFRIGLRYWSVTVQGDDSLAGAQCLASIAEAAPYNLRPRVVDPTEWFMIWGDASTMLSIRRGLEALPPSELVLAMVTELRAWEEWAGRGEAG
ncbi:hypothetical protein [Promicromonospora sp. NPDC023987]|uniref:hypothetical protein n=1 Tax=Promicromonospora sp. NPDC023987 TaxID=3155360 RepID=UPI00340DCFA6